MHLEQFSRTLEALYAAALEPRLWPEALEQVADSLGASSGWLAELDLAEGTGAGLVYRIDPEWQGRYFREFAEADPLSRTGPDGRGTDLAIFSDDEWTDREALVRTRFFNEFMRPIDVSSVLMIRLAAGQGRLVTLNVNRPARMGGFEAETRRAAAHLQPHLARAVELGRRLAREGEATDARARWGALRDPVLLVDGEARLLYANAAAETLLAGGAGLILSGGRLALAGSEADARLRALLHHASRSEGPCIGGAMALAGGRRLRVTPVLRDRAPLFEPRAAALVLVERADTAGEPARDACLIYQLTPAETRVALGIVAGRSPRQIAAAAGVSLNTVRNQLQRVYEKTGVSRQAELVRLLGHGETRAD
jgi:DNA-binding CsgD family transcriptional regulator